MTPIGMGLEDNIQRFITHTSDQWEAGALPWVFITDLQRMHNLALYDPSRCVE